MPNPGGMYRGCERCRRRKVKCDRTQPGCNRCVRYGRPCPGYPEERDIRFRHETNKTLLKMNACVVHASSSNPPLRKDSTDTAEVELTEQEREGRSLPAPDFDQTPSRPSVSLLEWVTSSASLACALNMPGETVMTCYFFDQVLMTVGWYSYLPELYQRAAVNGCLKLTVTTAGLFLAANQVRDHLLRIRASTMYSLVLKTINASISDPVMRLEDETLFAILILNILDDITGEKSFAEGTHLNGCAQLLKLREEQGVWTSCTPDLMHSIFIQTQAQVVRTYQSDSWSLKRWLLAQSSERPAALIYKWCMEIGRLRSIALELFASSPTLNSMDDRSPLNFLEEARVLDSRATNWHVSGGSRWSFQRTTLLLPTGQPSSADFYTDVQVAKVWNQYRSARIMLQETIVLAAHQFSSVEGGREITSLHEVERDALAIIASMLSGICDSIPFHLQRIDSLGRQCTGQSQRILGGCALIWPLETILRCPWSCGDHRQRARQALEEIGVVIGVRQATVSAAQASQDSWAGISPTKDGERLKMFLHR